MNHRSFEARPSLEARIQHWREQERAAARWLEERGTIVDIEPLPPGFVFEPPQEHLFSLLFSRLGEGRPTVSGSRMRIENWGKYVAHKNVSVPGGFVTLAHHVEELSREGRSLERGGYAAIALLGVSATRRDQRETRYAFCVPATSGSVDEPLVSGHRGLSVRWRSVAFLESVKPSVLVQNVSARR